MYFFISSRNTHYGCYCRCYIWRMPQDYTEAKLLPQLPALARLHGRALRVTLNDLPLEYRRFHS